MAEIDENFAARKQEAELFTQALEEFVVAIYNNSGLHSNQHVCDVAIIDLGEKRAAFVDQLLKV